MIVRHFVPAAKGPDPEGYLWGWGANSYNQLGLTGTQYRELPIRIGISKIWVAVADGNSHSLALRNGGYLFASGRNNWGQLGLGDTTDRTGFTQVGTDKWKAIACGAVYSFGIRSDGYLFAWGLNSSGQLGLGDAIAVCRFQATAIVG